MVFDEAHNIGKHALLTQFAYSFWPDNVCIESLSIDLTRPMLDAAGRSVAKLSERIEEWVVYLHIQNNNNDKRRVKATDAAKLQDEYAKLVEGLQEAVEDEADTDGVMGNPRSYFSLRRNPMGHQLTYRFVSSPAR